MHTTRPATGRQLTHALPPPDTELGPRYVRPDDVAAPGDPPYQPPVSTCRYGFGQDAFDESDHPADRIGGGR